MNEQINDNKIVMGGSNNGSDGSTNIDSNSSSSSWQNETQSELDQAEYEQAAYSPPEKKSLFNKNSLFFMGACVFAVLMMYVFGLKNKEKEASAQDLEVETSIDQMLLKLGDQADAGKAKDLLGNSSEMIKLFYDYSSKPQVGLKDLKQNPFERSAKPKIDPGTDRAALKASLTGKLMALKLRSVMNNSNGGICNVSGKMYSVGTKILDTFEVKAVGDDHVTLTSSGFEFILKM